MTRSDWRCGWLFCLALAGVASLSGISRSETLDEVVNSRRARHAWVSDRTGVLDSATEQRLNRLIDGLERQTTAEIAVVTIQRTDGRTPKQFATALFNRWGVGKRGKNNGVLVLLVMEARRIEVETGTGLATVLSDAWVQEMLHSHVIPRFKAGDFGGGVYAGVQELADAITTTKTTAPKPVTGKTFHAPALPQSQQSIPKQRIVALPPAPRHPAPKAAPTAQTPFDRVLEAPSNVPPPGVASPGNASGGNINIGAGIMPLLLALLGIPLAGYALWRSTIRRCPQCGQQMRRLDESQDDAVLEFAQQFEEKLGSVDYRVWRCNACGTMKIERAARWLSSYDDCPQCGHRTAYVDSATLRQPSYDGEGEKQITRTCRFPGCTYRDQRRVHIPRLTRPTPSHAATHHAASSMHHSHGHSPSHSHGHSSSNSSHSSGSFGGGSSSGGGAGASW